MFGNPGSIDPTEREKLAKDELRQAERAYGAAEDRLIKARRAYGDAEREWRRWFCPQSEQP